MKYESQVKCEEHIEDTYNSSSLQEEDHVDGLPCFFFTKLKHCTQLLSRVNIFVGVMQVNPIKEVKVKSGNNLGQFIKVSTKYICSSIICLFTYMH